MNQLTTMTTTSIMNEFSPEAQGKCAEIMHDTRRTVFASRDLYKLLLFSGHLKDDQEYSDVINDVKFMMMLKDYMASNLDKDKSTSLYGLGLISEYDLYWKVDTDQELCMFFKEQSLTITTDQMIMLKNERRLAKRFVTETRTNVLMNMGIPDTPLTKKQQEQYLVKSNEQIQSDIAKRADKNLQSKLKKRKVINDEAEELVEKDVEVMSVSETASTSTSSVPKKFSSTRCKLLLLFFYFV